LVENGFERCGFLQGIDPGSGRFCPPSEAIRTPIARKAQQAFASRGAFVPACGEQPVEVWPAASRAECDRILPAFERIRRPNCCLGLQNESLVT